MPGKILVVDSDMVTRRAAMYALLPAGYEMKIAEGPFEAFGIAQKEQPDVIVLGASVMDDQGLSLVGRLITAAGRAPHHRRRHVGHAGARGRRQHRRHGRR